MKIAFQLCLSLCVCICSMFVPFSAQAITIEVSAIVPGCGDSIIATGEQCDLSNLNGQSCVSQGFSGGTIFCTSACTFNVTSCTAPVSGGGNSSGGGSGGGGSGTYSPPIIPNTNVVFSGRAYPKSTVILLKDAQVAATTIAGADAVFQMTISGVSTGNYTFSLYSEDAKGLRSSLLTFPVGITSGVTTKVSGIFIAPTISADKIEVKKGDTLVIFGHGTPTSEVTVSVNSEEEFFLKKTTDLNGAYLLNFDTSVLELGQHHIKSKASFGGEISPFSSAVAFVVGTRNVLAKQVKTTVGKADLNGDNRVNLIDFSMAAFWYRRPSPPASSDLNHDGRVDLVDFSIMAFNWTG